MVFGRLLPREGHFFELFNAHGSYILQGAEAFMAMVQNYENVELREQHAREVIAAEQAADKITAEVHRLLHRIFITPLDRDQIHRLINAMDDVLDLLQDSSEVMSLYDLQHLSTDVVRLSEISVRWGLAGHIVLAWVVTIPATAFIAALFYGIGRLLF